MFDYLEIGLTNVLTLTNLLAISFGTALGLFVGAMPGLSATMAIAILLPLTFNMPPATGLSMLASLYMGAMYGGSIAAILIRTPGTPAAAATVLDGYPMAQQGRAGKALGVSLFASLIGGVLSSIALLTIAPILGSVALQFGPVELFAVAVLGITIIGSLSQGSAVKGLLSGVVGLLLATVGMDPITGSARFTFGILNLYSGVSFTVALIGLFSIPQAIRLIEKDDAVQKRINSFKDKMLPTLAEIRQIIVTVLRSSLIGIFTGIIPGTGGDTACWFGYNEAKRFSKNKDNFGKGDIEGVAASEAANNAVVGGALIPTLTLGIPGSSATAILMGALMVHGIMPGPTLMTEYADVTYTLIWALLFSNFFMFFEGLMFTRAAIHVTRVPNKVLSPIIIILCVIGSFAINNSFFDVYMMLIFGLLGYFMDKIGVPTAPMVVGLILGQMLNVSLHQSLMISGGSWMIFFSNPISTVLLIIAAISVFQATPLSDRLFNAIKSAMSKS
ncbi:tripartite tricarboxylate transporter permease [Acidaminobacter hydrogenoformans]|uniref:Putative tricarboxylic transport membrane protein n=1 Tax=Acidaminobacter hydrogenoformans DSM 2784 TaxID=1120920 RepID=A0A1G5RWF5_9FIRM|nr:tripartite tricarboxylate transporter permease [Acidaminobacter hydrogenoformans]SCZ78188.1 putative tricarboxylic transport membrane protein [Acidaminobacter hydrogenoformans DSM 2784]